MSGRTGVRFLRRSSALLSLCLVSPMLAEIPAEFADAEARWKPLMQEFRVPGMAVAVVRDGRTVFSAGLGKRDPDRDAPVTPDTVFFTGSVSRTFVATAAMLLAEEGKLELDAPVKKYLPKFQLADASLAETLTVRDLLTQGKGLSNGWIDFRANVVGQLDDGTFDRLLPKSKTSGAFRDEVLHALLLGRVVEAVAGRSWKELVQSRLIAPANMTRTFLTAGAMYAATDAAVPVEDLGGVFYATRFPRTDGTMHAGGGLGSSAADLARWVALNLSGGSVVPESVLKSMHAPQLTLNSRLFLISRESYGLGWYVGGYGGKRLVHELGGSVGARAHVSFMPEAKVGVVVLCNVGGAQALFCEAVACDVYERLLKLGGGDPFAPLREFLAKNAKTSAATAEVSSRARPAEGAGLLLPVAAYLGRYVHDDWGTLEVTQKDGELYLSLGECRLETRTAGTDHFEFDLAGGVKHGQFLMGPNKTVIAVELKIDLVHHTFNKQ